jgi:predicted PurR-regulated permease PerM
MLSGAAGVFSTTLGFLVDVVVVLFVGFYLAVQPDLYKNGFLRLVPHAGRIRTSEVLDEIALTLRWWLLGRTCAMVAIAVTTALGLWLLSVPLALILGILAGVLNFVPNIGPLISAVPALLLSLTQSPVLAAYVAALYVGIQFVESYLVTPLVQQHTVSMPPALTITAQVFMGVLFGGLGLLLATPLTAALLVAVHRLYVEDVLESPTIVRPTSTENASEITFHEARPKTASAESASVAKPR